MMNAIYADAFNKEIPSYLVPDPDNGDTVSSWIASIYAFTDLSLFCELTTTADMMTVQQMMTPQSHHTNTCPILNYALGMEIGPCAFLTILPAIAGEPQHVSVIHGLRQCHAWPEIYSFVGDAHPPHLPTIKMEQKVV
jgi:hypothetical protein